MEVYLKVLGLWANNGPKNFDKGGALARHIILKISFPAKKSFHGSAKSFQFFLEFKLP
jgi:hypothetical protein